MDSAQFKQMLKTQNYITAGSNMHLHMHEMSERALKITSKMNEEFENADKVRHLFSQLIGKTVDSSFVLFPPFNADYGQNINIGKGVFINSGCCFQDQGGITIGDNVLIGPQVVIATLNHDLSPKHRKSMVAKAVTIEDNVWIGAHATICPGVTIGSNSIVAAGAVVTRDVPANVVVGGVPAVIIKSIENS